MKSRYSKEHRELIYMQYVGDSLHLSAQNQYLTTRFSDMICPAKKADNRTADEIALSVIKNAGLRIK